MKNYFRTIKSKIIASVVFINTSIMLIFIVHNTIRDYNVMVSYADKSVHSALSIMSANSSPWLLSKDFVALYELIDNAKKIDGFRYASVMDAFGGVVASSDKSHINQLFTDQYSVELMERIKSNDADFAESFHHDLIDVIYSIDSNGKTIGYIRAMFDRSHISKALERLLFKAVIYSLLAVLLGTIFVWGLMGAFSKRIKRLTRSAVEISRGDLNVELPAAVGHDEVDMLIRALTKMQSEINKKICELNEANSRLEIRVEEEIKKRREQELILVQQSKLASMGEMINAIAHQWRQPLSALVLLVQDLEDAYKYGDLNGEYLESSVKKSMELANFMSSTINDFRNFFKPTKEAKEFDLAQSIDEALKILSRQLLNHNIKVSIEKPEGSTVVWGYQNEFKQVVVNILNNARQAILEARDSGEIVIKIVKKDNCWKISICDNGIGVKSEQVDKVFEPYYTTKLDSGGTGVGLYMSKIIIEKNMNGRLKLIPQEIGVCVEITLPNRTL